MATLKVREVRCPECNELLDINSGRMIGFCPYCGKNLKLEEETTGPSFTYTYNKNENKKEHIIDEAKIMHEQAKLEAQKSTNKANILFVAIYMLAAVAIVGLLALTEILA